MPSIINPDDKAGLEAALRLKDELGATVSVVSMGPPQADAVLREAMAMGADEAFLVTDPRIRRSGHLGDELDNRSGDPGSGAGL